MPETLHHQLVIVGGGTAGITVAAALRRREGRRGLDIAIVEPAEVHNYQPAFTLSLLFIPSALAANRPCKS